MGKLATYSLLQTLKLAFLGAGVSWRRICLHFSRKGALEELGGHLDVARDALTIRGRGVDIPLKVNEMGRHVLSVVSLGEGPLRVDREPKLAASYAEWALLDKRPDLSDRGIFGGRYVSF